MNKFQFYLIFLLLLSYYFIKANGETPEITGCEGESETDCSGSNPSNPLYKCELKESVCSPVLKTCAEAETLTAMEDIDCSLLTTEEIICANGNNGCIIPQTCEQVTSGGNENICKKFLVDDPINKCEFIAKTEEGTKDHCEPKQRDCLDPLEGVTLDQDKCSSRLSEGKFCYFDGTSCKEASNCGEIELSSETTKALCSHFDSGDDKCVPKEQTCELKKLCGKDSPRAHECEYYALADEEKVCVSKLGSTTECEEITQAEAEERELNAICLGKNSEECKLILENNILVECQMVDDSCKVKAKYETCTLASSLSEATEDQCSKLKVDLGQECIKGTAGCEVKIKTCTDETIQYEDGICDKLTPSTNKKCYYNGEKCAEADSCENLEETKLTTDKQMEDLCHLFDKETQECVPDGKKCKLQDKEESGAGDKEKEKESGKEGGDGDGKEKESGKEGGDGDKEKEKESGKEGGDADGKEKESGKEEGDGDGKEKESGKENEKEKETEEKNANESNSSGFISFSFALLFFIFEL